MDRPYKELMARPQLWETGLWDQLCDHVVRLATTTSTRHEDSETQGAADEFYESWKMRFHQATQKGNISRAANALLQGNKLLDATTKVIEAVQKLNTQFDPPPLPSTPASDHNYTLKPRT